MIFGTGEPYTADGNRAAEDATCWRWHPELHSREASLAKKYGLVAASKRSIDVTDAVAMLVSALQQSAMRFFRPPLQAWPWRRAHCNMAIGRR